MTQAIHRELRPGVRLTAVHTDKFKTSMLSLSLLAPLEADTAASNALLPYVLRRGTEAHPDMAALSAALDELYGGSIEPFVRKKGETQAVGFVASFLDDAYALDGSRILEPAAELLGELLLRPAIQDGVFRRDYVEGERANLIDRIRAQMNEKRAYSIHRLTQEMCAGEAFGVGKLGDEASAAAVSAESLWAAYQHLLATAPLEIYYCGSAPVERVETALRAAIPALPRSERPVRPGCKIQAEPAAAEPRLVTESLDVTQGKLALGFRTGGISVWSEEHPALLVFNAVYGGTATSKLFLNVREKLSLCYFASSMLEKYKGLLLVSSGIEFQNYEKAKGEILAQLDACREGKIEDWELQAAKRAIVSSLRAGMDSQSRMEDYWSGQAAAGLEEDQEALIARVEQVTAAQVAEAARRTKLDTVYFLKGLEG